MSPESDSPRLAVFDADSGFVRPLVNRLERAGWPHRVHTATIPPDELVAMRLGAVLVDPACLGVEGWAYLERLCAALPDLAVVVCTGRSTVGQRVRGLRLGADDWITKPCHAEEVMARIAAVTRRRSRAVAHVPAPPAVVGELEVRPDQFQAFVAGRSVGLTRREFEVLRLLAEAGGRVLQREEIYQRVWGYAMAHGDRSVDVFVRKLRAKIERVSAGWRYIHTHFGVGYRLQAEPVDGAEALSREPARRSTEGLGEASERGEPGARVTAPAHATSA